MEMHPATSLRSFDLQLSFPNLKGEGSDFLYAEEDLPSPMGSPSLRRHPSNYSNVQSFFLRAPSTKAFVGGPAVIGSDCQLEGSSASVLEKEHANSDEKEEFEISSPQKSTTASVHSEEEKNGMTGSQPEELSAFFFEKEDEPAPATPKAEDSFSGDFTSSKTKRRKRKNKEQVGVLTTAFFNNPNWKKDEVRRLAREVGLSMSQVYKWNWDMKKKHNILPKRVYICYPEQESLFATCPFPEKARVPIELLQPPSFE